MKKLALAICLMTVLTGCAALGDIADIIAPEPVPVCDNESVGAKHDGMQCLKLSDDTYRWVAK